MESSFKDALVLKLGQATGTCAPGLETKGTAAAHGKTARLVAGIAGQSEL
jgi:hypothetical protein